MALLFRIPSRIFVLLLVAGAAASLFSLLVVKGLDATGIEAPRTTLDVLVRWQTRVEKVRKLDAIAYLGDSTALSDQGHKHTIPGRISALLGRVEGMPKVVSLADAGLGPVDYYLLADELGEARPAAIVLSLNLASLSSLWLSRSSHPELASVLGVSRWPQAFGLPLAASGLTADRLLLYPSIHLTGLSASWRELVEYQARVLAGWRALENRLDGPYGPLAVSRLAGLSRLAAEKKSPEALRVQQRARYGKAIDGLDPHDPSLQILGAALQDWHSAGIPVLLVILPVNVELFESLGIANPAALQETSNRLAKVAQAKGTHFLDLHALLPAVSFADPYGHFAHGAEPDGARRIASRVVPILETMLRGRR